MEERGGEKKKERETGSMEERDRHRPVELGKKPVRTGADEVKRARCGVVA